MGSELTDILPDKMLCKIKDINLDLSKFYYLTTDGNRKNDKLNLNENEDLFMKLLLLSRHYKKLIINTKDFFRLIANTYDLQQKINCYVDPITQKELLISGLYCTIGACQIYVSKDVPSGYVEINNENR